MKTICHDCNAKEGELHKENCDMEICPKCKGQLLSCDCNVKDISIDEKFFKIGRKAFKREPYLNYPVICAKCGELYPVFFNVSTKEWKKTIGITFKDDDVLCKSCFKLIRKLRKLPQIKLKKDTFKF
jgi:uncharacterized protein YbaR (Trm112 family)